MQIDSHGKALVRLLRNRFGLGAIIAFILATNLWQPLGDYLTGQITFTGGLAHAWLNLSHFVDNPIIRIGFAIIALWLLGVAASRVIAADQSRAEENARMLGEAEAQRTRLLEEANQRHADSVSAIRSRLDELVEEAAAVPSILAAQGRIREKVSHADEELTRANNTLHGYQATLNQIRDGLGMGAHNLTRHLAEQLRSTVDVLYSVGNVVAETVQLDGIEEPQPTIRSASPEGEIRFDPVANRDFIAAHDNNIRLLQREIDRLRSAASVGHTPYAQLERELERRLGRFNDQKS